MKRRGIYIAIMLLMSVGMHAEQNTLRAEADRPGFGTGTKYDVNLDFGMTYMPHPRVQLDLYAGINCYHTEPIMRGPKQQCGLGLGVTWLLHTPNGFLDKYKKK